MPILLSWLRSRCLIDKTTSNFFNARAPKARNVCEYEGRAAGRPWAGHAMDSKSNLLVHLQANHCVKPNSLF